MPSATITTNGSTSLGMARRFRNTPGYGGSFTAKGTFGGGTLVLEMQEPDGSWTVVNNSSGSPVSMTAANNFNVVLFPGIYGKNLRATLSGATSPSIYVNLSNDSEF